MRGRAQARAPSFGFFMLSLVSPASRAMAAPPDARFLDDAPSPLPPDMAPRFPLAGIPSTPAAKGAVRTRWCPRARPALPLRRGRAFQESKVQDFVERRSKGEEGERVDEMIVREIVFLDVHSSRGRTRRGGRGQAAVQ